MKVIIKPTSTTGLDLAIAIVDELDERDWRAKARLMCTAGSEWWIPSLLTREGYEGQGHGRALVDAIRAWAGEHGYTVRTVEATSEAYGFYLAVGCRWLDEKEDFVVADPARPGCVPT